MAVLGRKRPSSRMSPHAILGADTMPEYVIEREIPGAGQMTEEQIREVSMGRSRC